MKLSGNKIIITGGASGIGLGLAGRFAETGNEVIICGRREPALAEASASYPGLVTRRCDLAVSSEREAFYNWISDEHPDANVLINNAGIQQRMSLHDDHFFARAKEEIRINTEAQVHMISLFLGLKSLDTIINVTSGLGIVPMTRVAVYSATKAFFHSFTLSLREIVKPDHIEVIEIIPPAVNTDLGGKGAHSTAMPVGEFIDMVFSQLKEGRISITAGFTGNLLTAGPEEQMNIFRRMNGG